MRKLVSSQGRARKPRANAEKYTFFIGPNHLRGSIAQKGTIHDLRYDAVHVLSRAFESDRHLHRVNCAVWHDRWKAPRWIERDLLADHRVDQHHGLFLSFPRIDALVIMWVPFRWLCSPSLFLLAT